MKNQFQRLTQVHMRRKVAVLALTLPLLAATATVATATEREREHGREHGREQEQSSDSYAIGLWGDLPYSIEQEAAVTKLIADMNAQKLAFTVHDGDLKAGSNSPCDAALYSKSLGYFNALKAPAMFTPGDNDWTDCDRPSNGGYVSSERLAYERKVFFNTPYSLGQRRLKQDVQPVYVENRRWTIGKVTYATVHVVGSCNNLCDTAPDPAEYKARNTANIAWMRETFKVAKARNAAAVMLVTQGNPGWDQSDPTRSPLRDPKTLKELDPKTLKEIDPALDGFQEFLSALRSEVIAFRKPVAYVHGDSHYYRIDKPFQDQKGRRLENFTRIETFGNTANGANDVHWVKVFVDPRSREVFSYQNQVVPANRLAVPAP